MEQPRSKASNVRARFIFFKMFGCGPCTAFEGAEGDKNSSWNKLLADKDLQSLGVSFAKISHGFKNKGDKVKIEPPKEYSFVNYGPYLWLEAPGRTKDGKVIGETFTGNRTADEIKRWIMQNLTTNPKFASVVQQQPVRKPHASSSSTTASSNPHAKPITKSEEKLLIRTKSEEKLPKEKKKHHSDPDKHKTTASKKITPKPEKEKKKVPQPQYDSSDSESSVEEAPAAPKPKFSYKNHKSNIKTIG